MTPPAPRRSTRPPVYDSESAQVLALKALAFVAGDEAALLGFLRLTGTAPEALRRRAAEPAFLGAVLDYLLSDEALLTAFAGRENVPPEAPAAARRRLPGAVERD